MILDTNALSAMAEGDLDLATILRDADEVALPVIVLGEFRYGIRRSRYRARYERWLSEALPRFAVLDIDVQTAEYYAEVRSHLQHRGRPIPINDVWIAALANQYELPVLSRDLHFDSVPGMRRIGW